MSVDNFEQIKKILNFESDDDDFYLIQILKRRKENPDLSKGTKVIHDYYLYTLDDLDKLKPKIAELCQRNNARAYIRLNKRSLKQIALQTLKLTADYIASGNHKAVRNVYSRATGTHSNGKSCWILDIDEPETLPLVEAFIADSKNKALESDNRGIQAAQITILTKIPTLNGIHIITKPFNPVFYSKIFNKDGVIHKDSPTLLYYCYPLEF